MQFSAILGGFVQFWSILAQARSQNMPGFQVPGLVKNVHSYCSPRHRMTVNSRKRGCETRVNDLAGNVYRAVAAGTRASNRWTSWTRSCRTR